MSDTNEQKQAMNFGILEIDLSDVANPQIKNIAPDEGQSFEDFINEVMGGVARGIRPAPISPAHQKLIDLSARDEADGDRADEIANLRVYSEVERLINEGYLTTTQGMRLAKYITNWRTGITIAEAHANTIAEMLYHAELLMGSTNAHIASGGDLGGEFIHEIANLFSTVAGSMFLNAGCIANAEKIEQSSAELAREMGAVLDKECIRRGEWDGQYPPAPAAGDSGAGES